MITSSFGEPGQVGNPHVEIGVAAGDAGGGGVGEAAEQPDDTMPHSAFVSSARRAPIAAISSSRWTCCCAAASIAARTSGSISEPLMMVNVPRALISGRTPID